MEEYRAYIIGSDGHFKKVQVLECPDDAAAVKEAKKLLDGHDIELWLRDRMIIRLEHK